LGVKEALCSLIVLLVSFAQLPAQSVTTSASAPRTSDAAQVTIVGDDYAFLQPPTTLPAGLTLFSFQNRGRVRHEMVVGLLKPGVSVRDYLDVVKQLGRRRDLLESTIGLLMATPADTSGGRLLAWLIPGRSYIVVCTLRDTPDAQPHAMLGMISGFTIP